MKCKNKTASCNDETCPFDEMFGLKEDPPSQEFTSSIKAFTKGSDTLLEVIKWGAQATRTYSKMIFIPAKNKMIESVQPAKIPLWCWCQLLIRKTICYKYLHSSSVQD